MLSVLTLVYRRLSGGTQPASIRRESISSFLPILFKKWKQFLFCFVVGLFCFFGWLFFPKFKKILTRVGRSWKETVTIQIGALFPEFSVLCSQMLLRTQLISTAKKVFSCPVVKKLHFFPVGNLSLFRIKSRLAGQSFITAMLK